MSDWLGSMCITAGIIWITFIGYRLYFNVPDIDDDIDGADVGRTADLRSDRAETISPADNSTPETSSAADHDPAELLMQEVYSDASETLGSEADDLGVLIAKGD
jgi:hypothetical protein